MLLDVKPFLKSDYLKKEFSYSLDISSDLEDGSVKLAEPVLVSGYLRANSGVIIVSFKISTNLKLCCDRCLTEFISPFSGEFTHRLVRDFEKNVEDAVLLENDCLDLDKVVLEDILVSLPIKSLCSENCKGLCPFCGANRNINENCCDGE